MAAEQMRVPAAVQDGGEMDVRDRGMFDFTGKEEDDGRKKPEVLENLRRSGSSSSSSSGGEEEVEGEGGIKQRIKKKKNDLKSKIDQKANREEKHEEPPMAAVASPKEEKGFLGKVKDKLLGQQKKPVAEGGAPPAPAVPAPVTAAEHGKEEEVMEGQKGKEKKGFLGKIMEKLAGSHRKEGAEGAKTAASRCLSIYL
ncbi:Dehydrin COR410 [Apostasia shenzhenica]|uniref:Dehydrin COR410 n=1 Tax=Apostasia shenzhenica TaxID=1088818 RepID=A0A2I0AEM1_9ASPA|nr:Dehydrin COR410 [Apostasia shenzhenica]